jgi:hypothetical protein
VFPPHITCPVLLFLFSQVTFTAINIKSYFRTKFLWLLRTPFRFPESILTVDFLLKFLMLSFIYKISEP